MCIGSYIKSFCIKSWQKFEKLLCKTPSKKTTEDVKSTESVDVYEVAGWVANSADPDQMPILWRLARVYIVCSRIFVQYLSKYLGQLWYTCLYLPRQFH